MARTEADPRDVHPREGHPRETHPGEENPLRDEGILGGLRARFGGTLVGPGDDLYDEARSVYNAMIDRHPGLVAYCADVADVRAGVDFAREHGLLLAIRGGGHSGPGLGVCDGGLVLDLSRMRGIRVDPEARTARVEGGCTWGDVDHATHAFGMATPSGIISTTGVGGLTLGGGHGYLSRKYGLTIDNLLSADVVLADGRFVTASEDDHPDLFWALRGGGGNFGVVTSFEFRLHPVHTVVGGPTFWPLERSSDVLAWYRDFIVAAPRELSGWFGFMAVPPDDAFPENLHGQKVCGVVWCYTGDPTDADEVFEPVRSFGPPSLHGVQPMPYPTLQSAFDDLYPPGHQWYWKGDFVRDIGDEAIARHVEHGSRLPTPQSTMHLYPVDGAPQEVDPGATAWSHREANWSQVIVGVDPDPDMNETTMAWAREYWQDLHPYSTGGAYVNFMMDEGEARVKATYRDNFERLTRVKSRYDPENLFRMNQNIRPGPSRETAGA